MTQPTLENRGDYHNKRKEAGKRCRRKERGRHYKIQETGEITIKEKDIKKEWKEHQAELIWERSEEEQLKIIINI